MSSNASATLFGWDFQVNAAIVLFLENIKYATSIRLEGATEDIEIKLHTDDFIYAQAKSVVEYNDYSNVRSKLKKGLKTLNEAALNNSERLIYITNTSNPFNMIETVPLFVQFGHHKYIDLKEDCKSIIDQFLYEIQSNSQLNIETEHFEVVILPFHSNVLENRYSTVKQKVIEFLNKLRLQGLGLQDNLLDFWQHELFANGSKTDTDIVVKKSQFVWPIIALITELEGFEKQLQVIPNEDAREISETYKSFIDSKCEQFSFITKVLTDYQDFQPIEMSNKDIEFADAYSKYYKEEFDDTIIDATLLDILIKIIILKIVDNKHQINTIKREVRL